MSDPRFLQEGFEKQLSHFIEECGEALAAAGKTQRWGPYSYNPTIPASERETNLIWLRTEMRDVREQIERLDKTMQTEFGCDPL